MSADALVTVFCDAPGCGQWWDSGVAPTAKQARSQLQGTGWKLGIPASTQRRALDFCPEHNHLTAQDVP